jgi:hypothetical protein
MQCLPAEQASLDLGGLGPVRRSAGPMPAFFKISHTAGAETPTLAQPVPRESCGSPAGVLAGQPEDQALLARAMDEILGTHRHSWLPTKPEVPHVHFTAATQYARPR